jgi:hypothetical protein
MKRAALQIQVLFTRGCVILFFETLDNKVFPLFFLNSPKTAIILKNFAGNDVSLAFHHTRSFNFCAANGPLMN